MTDFESSRHGGNHGGFDRDGAAYDAGDTSSNLYQDAQASSSSARQILQANAEGIVILPEGVSLDDIVVQGRDLVINLADGSTIVIPDGAIIVPQLVVEGVAVPPLTLAALLNEAELNPEAGPNAQTPSSGGNFAGDEGAIQAAFDLGNLLPYTELGLNPEEEEEIIPFEDSEPEIIIETPDNPIGVPNAIARVDEAGLPERGEGPEPEGTEEPGNGELTSGTIVITSPDGISALFINGIEITGDNQEIETDLGILTILSVNFETGEVEFEYLLTDNTSGDDTSDPFLVRVIDLDGDEAEATLTVLIVDDEPIANADEATIPGGQYGPAEGNVIDNDISGADDFPEGPVTGISFAGTTVLPGESIEGDYGVLTIDADGSYSYTRNPDTPGGVQDVFTYTIEDQDGSPAEATLTINIGNLPPEITFIPETGAGTEVFEEGLPARGDETEGSNEPGNGEFTGGTITFESPDGVSEVTIAGVVITPGALPQTVVDDATGTLVITGYSFDADTGIGSITYEYTLVDNTSGDDTPLDFPITIVDLDEQSAEGTLTIVVRDDEPEALADTDSVTDDTDLTAEGNVITDSEGNGGADTQGADGASVTGVAVGTVEGPVDGNVATEIDGLYGTLTIAADGTYTYTLDPANPAVSGLDGEEVLTDEIFTYTITDGDGDQSTTTLSITVNGQDDPVVINGLDGEGAEEIVDEDDLADGSSPNADALTQSGTFTVDSPDGLATLTVGGETIFGGGVTYPVEIAGDYGTVRITGVSVTTDADGDVVAAEVSYEYVLGDNTLNHSVAGEDSLTDSFAVVATDTDGSPANASLDIRVIDDIAAANADSDSVTEDGPLVADGNVLTGTGGNDANDTDGVADVAGADGATVTGVAAGNVGADVDGNVATAVTGNYGSITIDSNGDYVYTLDNDNPAVQGLNGTESLSEVFTYTITDGDGDTATTTVTIVINGQDDPVVINGLDGQGAEEIVDEDDLADGSSPDEPALTQGGTFSVDSPDGLSTLTVGGVEIFDGSVVYPVEIVGEYGTVRITGVTPTTDDNGDVISIEVAYEYVLGDNTLDHSPATGEDPLTDSFEVIATDSDGSTSTASLDVDVVDDVPDATDNANTVTEGGETDGNVLTDNDGDGVDVPGADGYAAGGAVVGITSVNQGTSDTEANGEGNFVLEGQYGTLTLNTDGSYTYVANPNVVNSDETDTFTYTIRDGDGDESTAELVITVTNVAGEVSDNDVLVNEAGLVDGTGELADGNAGNNSDTSETFATGQITVTGATGTLVFILEDPAVGSFGTLTLNTDGSYSYTLDTAFGHDPDAPGADINTANGVESFAYRVEDTNGNLIGSGEIVVSVIDDIPQVDLGLTQGQQMALITQDADTIGNASDTDSADFSGAFAIVSSLYGADGAGSLETTYALGLQVAEGTDSGLDSNGADIFLYVRADGTIVGSTAGSEPATNDASVIFTITVNGSGTVTLTQFAEVDHTIADDGGPFEGDIIALAGGLVELVATATITDGDGDVVSDSEALDLGGLIRFADDGPVAVADVNSVGEDDASVSGNVLTDGTPDSFGADGPATTTPAGGVVGVELGSDTSSPATGAPGTPIVGAWGTLTLLADGSYTYAVNTTSVQGLGAGDSETDTFIYTIEDGEGDTSTVTLTITINGANDAPTAVAGVAAVSDEGLADANPDNAGTPTDTTNSAVFLTGDLQIADADTNDTLDVTLGIPAQTISIVDGGSGTALTWAVIDGGNTLVGYVSDPNDPSVIVSASDDGIFTVEIRDAIYHDQVGVEDVEGFVVPVTVSDGTTSTPTTISVSLEDDSPVLTAPIADQQTSNNPSAPILVGDLNFAAGADGPSADMTITVDTTGLTVGGQPLATVQDGNVLTAFVDANANGEFDTGDTAAFTITVDPAAGLSGEYEFDLITPLDGETTLIDLLSDGAFGVGPSLSVIVSQDSTGDELVYVTGWRPNGNGGSFTGAELTDWLNGGNPDLNQVPGVNGSTAGFGINNNNFDAGEFMRFDFGPLDDYDGAGGYNPPGGTNLLNATFATFTMSNFGNGDVTHFVAHFSDGSTQEYTFTGSGGGNGSAILNITAPPGTTILFVDAYQQSGSVKLNLSDLGVTDTNVDIDIPVTIVLTDRDGDPVSDSFVININEQVPNAQDDLTDTPTQDADLNIAFVVDFSSSINASELNQELSAVRDAARDLFGRTEGTVSVTLVGFDEDAINFGTFTDLAEFEALISSINPADGGTRPLDFGTSYSDGLAALMNGTGGQPGWDPAAGDINQVFFISDGRASRDRGPDNYPLNDTVREQWEQFVADNDFEITAIAVGDNLIIENLNAVDIDGNGSPILIDDFSTLIGELITQILVPVSGNVLENDIAPSNGISLVSITVDGALYSFDGANITAPGGGTIAGSEFTATTAMGGEFTFDFATGDWTYAPSQSSPTGMENFQYTIVDGDGDTDTAILRIDLEAISGGGAEASPAQTMLSSKGDADPVMEAPAKLADDQLAGDNDFGTGADLANDNELLTGRGVATGQIAAAALGFTMVNFAETSLEAGNTSFTFADPMTAGLDLEGAQSIDSVPLATVGDMVSDMLGTGGFDMSGLASSGLTDATSAETVNFADFASALSTADAFQLDTGLDAPVGGFADAPMSAGLSVEGNAGMMEALLDLADGTAAAPELAAASGLATADSADVAAILADVMAEGSVDAMLDTFVGHAGVNPVTDAASHILSDASLTQTVDGSAFAFDATQLADMSAEAAAVAASVG
ncbi:VCBS domain-containing protein [Altererythrobacter sp. GH1-8]|uniref:VCBS domain-containing protein n=1 Tax=Altererythrobacter sp. GH1-8 TaxID=3349333 RepID=UPI00374DDD9E